MNSGKLEGRKSGSMGTETTVDTEELSRDETLEVLSNRRRRFAIHLLKQQNGDSISVSELAERIASWENGKPEASLTYKERKRVRNAIRQFHLPKMKDYGFIEYDSDRGTVKLTDICSSTDFYVDSLTGNKIPWSMYYLGISALGAVCLLGIGTRLFPFTALPPLAWGIFFVTALTVSSLGHFYDNYYRMRLGARETPPEVDEE